MTRRLTGTLGVALLLLAVHPALVSAQSDGAARKAKSRSLAERIDKIIDKGLQEAKIKPSPRAELAQLTRRLHIDLVGRIPTVVQLVDLIDPTNDSPTKLEDRIDELLASDSYAYNFSHFWRSVMLRGTNQQQAGPRSQFEGWLRARLASNTRYDQLARELLINQPGPPGATPAAFYTLNGNKAETLAGATARVFLGIKLECAECHPHPFAKWTRKQFWEFAAFFSNAQSGGGKQIKIPQTDKVVQAKFITGEAPDWAKNNTPRTTLADWTTATQNPYFAKAAVDHVWQYFFGVSLMEAILEPTEDSPPAHAELLDELAKGFIDSGFDLKFLIRSIVLTDAYQRQSVPLREATKVEIQMFARMPVRGMTPEQLFDCVGVATEYRDNAVASNPNRARQLGQAQNAARTQFLAMFNSQDRSTETYTSILQALFLMNGQFMAERSREAVKTIAVQDTSTQRRVEALYMLVLSRLPRASEMERMVRYIENGGGSGDPRQAVGDVCWVLLNSSEFMLNH
ncbi:MAG TPA: DUF1553 domain-containing protein [Gemmataceae bacterium]|nr:DUF1553 domain-containing protein [Gemmataceae bacterium]